jgi:hypothetical protein
MRQFFGNWMPEFLLQCLVNASPAFAGSKQCLNIKLTSERQACEDGKAASIVSKREPGLSDNPKMMDPVEILKLEDDRLAKRLRGICRGC